MDEQTLKLFSRLKKTPDGEELLKYLENVSKQNYEVFKRASSDINDICKGKALALDALLNLFYECDVKLTSKNTKVPSWT